LAISIQEWENEIQGNLIRLLKSGERFTCDLSLWQSDQGKLHRFGGFRGGDPEEETEMIRVSDVTRKEGESARLKCSSLETQGRIDLELRMVRFPHTLRRIVSRSAPLWRVHPDQDRALIDVPSCGLSRRSSVPAMRSSGIVPPDYEGTQIAIPIARNDARVSLMGWNGLDGRLLKQRIVFPRQSIEVQLQPPSSCSKNDSSRITSPIAWNSGSD
jgi:hypothetical protein